MRTSFLLCISFFFVQYAYSQCFIENVALYKSVEASSTSSGNPANIVDDNINSQWTSEVEDPQWIVVDLGITYSICAVAVQWDNEAFATSFKIELSQDNDQWEEMLSFENNDLPEMLLDELDWQARYMRIYASERSNPDEGYQLRELVIFGELEAPYQLLTFDPITDRLSTDDPIELSASATSGLPVSFEVIAGPATVDGSTLSFTGEGGTVVVEAIQEGNADYNATEAIERSFQLINPDDIFPQTIITSPSAQYPVAMPTLGQMAIGLRGVIERPEWFSIEDAELSIDGTPVSIEQGRDGHYYTYWTPEAYGMHTITAITYASTGNSTEKSFTFEIVEESNDRIVRTFDLTEVIAFVNPSESAHYQLPSNLAAFDKITASLDINCPSIGCDDWDRLAHIEVRNPAGEWVEFLRYITPYGEECSHAIDVTEYASILQGNPELRVRIGTFQRGWAVTLDLQYEAGTPEYTYSKVERLWYGYHAFGNPINTQPASTYEVTFNDNVAKADLHLVGTGHGWGENNTDNAAEFFDAIHHVLINDSPTFEHHNWTDCDPNPDGCQPQGGTWWFDRAGWCPGAISPFFKYDMSEYLDQEQLSLFYRMQTNYIDFCHPSNPNCNGSVCPNCNDGFNPHLVMATNLVTYSNSPIAPNVLVGTADNLSTPPEEILLSVYPNPTNGQFIIEQQNYMPRIRYRLFNAQGILLLQTAELEGFAGKQIQLDIGEHPAGLYYLVALTDKGHEVYTVVKYK